MQHLADARLAVTEKRTPPALGALFAIRSVVDGALKNQRLARQLAAELPEDAQWVQPGEACIPTEPGQLESARNPEHLLPVPWWVCAALVDVLLSLLDAANKEASQPSELRGERLKGLTAATAAEAFGAKGAGSGHTGFLLAQAEETRGKQMAIEIAALKAEAKQALRNAAVGRRRGATMADFWELVGAKHGCGAQAARRAWENYGAWAVHFRQGNDQS
jgi:hypothetical protein